VRPAAAAVPLERNDRDSVVLMGYAIARHCLPDFPWRVGRRNCAGRQPVHTDFRWGNTGDSRIEKEADQKTEKAQSTQADQAARQSHPSEPRSRDWFGHLTKVRSASRQLTADTRGSYGATPAPPSN